MFLNVIRTILALFVPLITYPMFQIIGVENLGKVNYVQSMVSYLSCCLDLALAHMVYEGAKYVIIARVSSLLVNEMHSICALYLHCSAFVHINISKSETDKTLFLISILILFDIGIEWVNTIFEDYLYYYIYSDTVKVY